MYVVVVVLDFVKTRPREELLHSKCSPRRGELDPPTPRVIGVFLVAVFAPGRKPIEIQVKRRPSKTATQETLDTLGAEESSSPRRVLHF